jgi:hypothetical protein
MATSSIKTGCNRVGLIDQAFLCHSVTKKKKGSLHRSLFHGSVHSIIVPNGISATSKLNNAFKDFSAHCWQ